MEQTLVIIIHPDLEGSIVNRQWMEALKKHPEKFTLHDLYAAYKDGKIDIQKEQQLLEAHHKIIFQFPFYWFSSPPLLKQWLDEVLTYGWAYGSKSGYKLKGKKIALAISAGIDEKEYRKDGQYSYTLQQLTAPLEITFKYVKADYAGLFAFYGIEHHATAERVKQSISDYLAFATAF